MRLVKFVDAADREVAINPENVLKVIGLGGHGCRLVHSFGDTIVRASYGDTIKLLTEENPVDEPAEPVVLSLVCKNCHLDQDSHMPNWLGGMNCSVFGDTQTYFEPEIRKA